MRNTPNLRIEHFRLMHIPHGPGENWGAFLIQRQSGDIRIIASDGTEPVEEGWEHVSVSLAHRKPNWDEMHLVKNLFWREDETVIQFHPKESEYRNFHPFCLHLWKKRGVDAELPPGILIAPERSKSDVEVSL